MRHGQEEGEKTENLKQRFHPNKTKIWRIYPHSNLTAKIEILKKPGPVPGLSV